MSASAQIENQKLKISIKTFGCQMNVYDSEVASGLLAARGYEIVEEGFVRDDTLRFWKPTADVVLMNTCSVREHAEDRVYSRLGMLKKAKKFKPDLIVGLLGCMVEEHREKLFRRFPELDLMIGTRNLQELPAIVDEVRKTRRQTAKIKQDGLSIEYTELIRRDGKMHAWLPIMTGCNKVCTFCIVPITRGSEVSMPAREVFREASRLAEDGVKWLTLLGQNVNSYDGQEPGKNVRFPELLDMLCTIGGIERISFTTSHPQDATTELYEVIRKNPKICRRFHLPLQSGSDRMLKRMKRLHTYADFKEKVEKMREIIPDVVLTTDIITGFSGETDEDHAATKGALQELRFDGGYIYKYSLRPGTPAAKLPDDVPFAVKESRHQELLKIQKEIVDENNLEWIGRTLTAFIEGPNPKGEGQMIARTDQDKKIIFRGGHELIGLFATIKIISIQKETFYGELC